MAREPRRFSSGYGLAEQAQSAPTSLIGIARAAGATDGDDEQHPPSPADQQPPGASQAGGADDGGASADDGAGGAGEGGGATVTTLPAGPAGDVMVADAELIALSDRRAVEPLAGWQRPELLKAMRRLLYDLKRRHGLELSQRALIAALLVEGPASPDEVRALVLRERERQADRRGSADRENFRVMVPRTLKVRYEDMIADLDFDEDFRTSMREVLDALLAEAPQTLPELLDLAERHGERVARAQLLR